MRRFTIRLLNYWRRPPARARAGIALAIALIIVATLVPDGAPQRGQVASGCILCGDFGSSDLLLNVVLFLPLGVALGWFGVGPWRALGIGLLVSAAIELLQLAIPGRASTVRDVLTNGVGCALGSYLAAQLPAWLHRKANTALPLRIVTVAVLTTMAATGFLMRLDAPDGVYYAHWVPDQRHLEHWTGTVSTVRIGGLEVPRYRVADPLALRTAVRSGAPVQLAGFEGRPTKALGGIFTISDDAQRELLLVGPRGDDLVFRVRRRSAALRLAGPEAVFPDALAPIPEGAPLEILLFQHAGESCAVVNGLRQCVRGPSVASAWMLFRFPGSRVPPARGPLDALTMALFALPIGVLRRQATRRMFAVALAALVVGPWALAASFGLALPSAWAWGGAVAGIAAGIAARQRR